MCLDREVFEVAKKKETSMQEEIDNIIAKIDERIKELEQEGLAKKEEIKNNIPNIDDLINKIEEKIAYLENKEKNNDNYIDDIIRKIDEKIAELEKEECCEKKFDIDKLTDKINTKIHELESDFDDELDKTIYDLSEISRTINATIMELERKRKEKKRKKAMYCDLARRNKKCCKNK